MKHLTTGVDYAAQGRFEDAKQEFEKISKADPLNQEVEEILKIVENVRDKKMERKPVIHFFKGASYVIRGQYDKAISDYNKAIELNPRFAKAYVVRGYAYERGKDQYDKAISDYNKAIDLSPNDASAYENRGLAYYLKRDYDKAISDYNKAIELNPSDAGTYTNRGIAYEEGKGQYDKAISDYSRAIELNPKIAEAYINRGIAYEEGKGQYNKAISDYSRAIELKPRDAQAYNNRGIAYIKLDQSDRACDDFRKACELGFCDGLDLVKQKGLCQ
jgi:tetratricopeptide (TPR) repeat protein